jgi:hypothetical protein
MLGSERPALRGWVGRFRAAWLARAFLLGCLSLSACGAEEDEASGAEARVSGTVRDLETRKRLEGVRVVFTSDTLEMAEDRTNDEGDFSILVNSRVRTGRLRASKSGYEAKQASVYLDEADVRVEMALPPAD